MNVYGEDGSIVAEVKELDASGKLSFTVPAAGTYVCRMHLDSPILSSTTPIITIPMISFVMDVHTDGKCHFKGTDISIGNSGLFIPEPLELDCPAFLNSTVKMSGSVTTGYGGGNIYMENTYNGNNKRTMNRMFQGTDSSGILLSTSIYTYDSEGLLASVTTDAVDDTKDRFMCYSYSGGKAAEIKTYRGLDSSGSLSKQMNFTYDTGGRLTNCKYFITAIVGDNLYMESDITYDVKGQASGITIYKGTLPDGTGKSVTGLSTITRDSNGYMVGYSFDSQASGNDAVYNFTLNSSGLPETMDKYKGDLPGSMAKIATVNYTYGGTFGLITGEQDPNGSWIFSYSSSWAQESLVYDNNLSDIMDSLTTCSHDADGNLSVCNQYAGKTTPSGTPDSTTFFSWITSN